MDVVLPRIRILEVEVELTEWMFRAVKGYRTVTECLRCETKPEYLETVEYFW